MAPHRILVTSLACASVAWAQDLEPRRWTHMPVSTNVVGLSYAYTTGDVKFDPVLDLDNVEVNAHSAVASYVRTFGAFGKTARFDVIVPYTTARWTGLLSGAPASTSRQGLTDPWLRMSVNLVGAPALAGEEFMKFRADNPTNTVAGVALGVMLPLGQYDSDKLINLGQNQFVFRPQAGFVHTRGAWSFELTGSTFFFADNTDFFAGTTRQQDPLFALQSHLIHTFPNRWWASASAGYGWGGTSSIDGVSKDDSTSNLLAALSVGFPIGQSNAIKLAYVHGDTQTRVGSDTDSAFVTWTLRF